MSYLDDIKNIWIAVKESLRDSLAQTVIDLWFGELEIVSFENNCLSFSTNSEFKYKIITETDDAKYQLRQECSQQ